jgi:hypothetical protein
MRAIVHPDLELSGTTLIDTYLGVRYFLTPDAAWLLGQLRREPSIDRLVPAIARHQRIPPTEARHALYKLLGLLGEQGMAYVAQSHPRGLVRPQGFIAWNRRYTGTVRGFVYSMARAYGLYIACSIVLFASIKILFAARLPWFWVWLPAGVLATCAVHEAGHAVAARLVYVPFVFLARRGRAAIMYTQPASNVARKIAAWGPLAAAIVCCGAIVFASESLPRYMWAMAGLLHLCSLLPFVADGKTIWRKS